MAAFCSCDQHTLAIRQRFQNWSIPDIKVRAIRSWARFTAWSPATTHEDIILVGLPGPEEFSGLEIDGNDCVFCLWRWGGCRVTRTEINGVANGIDGRGIPNRASGRSIYLHAIWIFLNGFGLFGDDPVLPDFF